MPTKFEVSSPSNIAFVKYWGKHGRQLPMNASLSMTLEKCKTNFEVSYDFGKPGVELEFEGSRNPKFEQRFSQYLESITDIYPLATELNLKIKSENTFPHSAGIASSASAMSALAVSLEYISSKETGNFSWENVSRLARLASGSACRSVFKSYSVWGNSLSYTKGSDDFGVEFTEAHSDFSEMCDSIVIISKNEKSVSSSAGHALMNGHPYRQGRIDQAVDNFRLCWQAMRDGNFETFGEVLENEALSLHALMLSSSPSYILLEPLSLELVREIRTFRNEANIPVYFTIDAGPNIHIIYPQTIAIQVKKFIGKFCEQYQLDVIHDHIGLGAFVKDIS